LGKEKRKNNINACGAGLWPAPNTAGEDACTTIMRAVNLFMRGS